MATYEENKAGGAVDKIKGKTNEVVGRATGDKSQEMKGHAQQGKGEVRDTIGDLQGKMREKRNDENL